MKNIYIIWKNQRDDNVKNVNEVVGLFEGTYEEADALIAKLNDEDDSVIKTCLGRRMYGYWRSEPVHINNDNYKEFIGCF